MIYNNLEWINTNKKRTHQVLLQTAFDILKSDIATWTDSLSQPFKKIKDQQEKNN